MLQADVVASGYQLPPPFNLAVAFSSWTFRPVPFLFVLVASIGYAIGMRQTYRNGKPWPPIRAVCFYGLGVGTLILATLWWPGVYNRALFWVYTLQVTVLLVVTPLFLALGKPITLAKQALPERASARIASFFSSRVMRLFASPFVCPLLIPLTLSVVFFTPVLTLTLRDPIANQLLQITLLLVGFFFAFPLADESTSMKSLAIAAGIFVGIVELLIDAIPGIVVRLRTNILAAEYFVGLRQGWGPSPLQDQQRGGAILWFLAEFMDLPFLALMLLRWIKTDKQEGADIDAELDRLAIAARKDAGSVKLTDALEGIRLGNRMRAAHDEIFDTQTPLMTQPWWEVNPEVFGEHRARQFRGNAPGKGLDS